MGDVAMMVPVIKRLLHTHKNLRVTVVSNATFEPFFKGIERCDFLGASLKTEHKGLAGLYRLFKKIKTSCSPIDGIADLHNVLRTKVIRAFFSVSGVPLKAIDKGRKEKALLTRKENKKMQQLATSHQRYANVFYKLGYNFELNTAHSFKERESLPEKFLQDNPIPKKLIGIAPFAQHKGKMYSIEKMKSAAKMLAYKADCKILFFGGGPEEQAQLSAWEAEMPGTYNVSGRFKLGEELSIISNLSLMISMDSANMHLASMYGVPVVSIWGATHPFAGFLGWAQNIDLAVQRELFCRPCSVFGNKPCYRQNWECMDIAPEVIVEKVLSAT